MMGISISILVGRALGNASASGQRYGYNSLRGTQRKRGDKEFWGRGTCIGHPEGAENIKMFVFHINAQEVLIIYKINYPVADSFSRFPSLA